MIRIENTETDGWKAAIRGMRNPMNSWAKSDSTATDIGPNDLALMKSLTKAGSDHAKFLRMINVSLDITAPLYWWKEFDTYKVGTVSDSCSTMHKIHEKKLAMDDFSHEHLNGWSLECLETTVATLNRFRDLYLESKDKEDWWQMIQLLPSSYNQRRTILLNYQVLSNQYHSRKNHKLDEWHEYCRWIESLPYSELITGDVNNE